MTEIRRHDGDRSTLEELLLLADDSREAIAAYRDEGELLVATDGDEVVAQLLLTRTPDPACREIKSVAVAERRQGEGIGRALVEHAVAHARADGARRLVVATAAESVGTLRFYQCLGFRMFAVERDAFGPERGYPPGILIDGIPLRDRVLLDREL